MRSFVALSFIGLAAAQKGRQATAPVYTCPPAFELVGKTCTRQTTAQAQLFCQTGILQGNQCLTPVPRDGSCPPGSTATPSGAGCSITESVPAEKFCPPNTHDIGGECQTYSVTGIVETCARGHLVGGQCEITETVPALVTKDCPLGYTQAKGSCWKSAQMECAAPHVGKRLLQAKGQAHMGGAVQTHAAAAAAAAAALPPPRYSAMPAKLAVTSKLCEVKLEAPFHQTSTCPGGMEKSGSGNTCTSSTFEPTTVECSLGAPHLCFPATTTPPNLRCAPGFQLAGQECNKTVQVAKNSFCPPGTIASATGCNAPSAALARCAPGQQLSGDLCIGTETVAPTVTRTISCVGKGCQ